MQIVLVNIPTRAHNFKIKRISNSLNLSTWKNKGFYVYLPIPYNWSSLSRGHQIVTIMNHCCYCFDGLWKVKAKYVVQCLNAFVNRLQNVKGAFRHPVLMGNCPNCRHKPWPYQSTEWCLNSLSKSCQKALYFVLQHNSCLLLDKKAHIFLHIFQYFMLLAYERF